MRTRINGSSELSYSKEHGFDVLEREEYEASSGLQGTLDAMRSGVQVIAQAYLEEKHSSDRTLSFLS